MRKIPKTSPPKGATGAGPRKAKVTAGLDEKRERILLVAEELFSRNGYAKTTMDQIVQQLGVTKPFVYYYFKSKQEIFEVLSWKPAVECFTTMDFPDDDVRPAHEKIMDGLERLIRSTLQYYPAAFFPYREPQAYRPEYRAAQKQLANHFYDRMCNLLEEGRKDGTLDFTETKITALAACSLPGFLFNWYRPDGRLSADLVAKELTRLACRVIGLRTASASNAGRTRKTPSKSITKATP